MRGVRLRVGITRYICDTLAVVKGRVRIGKGEIEGRIAIVPVHHGIARAGVKAVASVVPVDARESERVSDKWRVHDSIAAAHHHPRVDLIGEAEARAELSKIGILEGAPV